MPQYRTLEPVSFMKDGQACSVKADRVIELDEKQAQSLSGKILRIDKRAPSMFPDGAPIIATHFVRDVPSTPVAGEHVPAPEKAPKPAVSKPPQPKPESK